MLKIYLFIIKIFLCINRTQLKTLCLLYTRGLGCF